MASKVLTRSKSRSTRSLPYAAKQKAKKPAKRVGSTDAQPKKAFTATETRSAGESTPAPAVEPSRYRGAQAQRPDGIYQPNGKAPFEHYLPNEGAEVAALRHTLNGARAHSYQVPLGDLIVQALTGRDPTPAGSGEPENWATFEAEVMVAAARDMRAMAVASEAESTPCEVIHAAYTATDLLESTVTMARRLEATAELAKRLRVARWGHPSHGGYDVEEARLISPGWHRPGDEVKP